MKTKFLNQVLVILACLYLVFVSVYSYTVYLKDNSPYDVADGELVITNLDVGKADSAVITLDGVNGMIDTGLEESYTKISAYLDTNHIESLDFLILTHYDKDHVGSAEKLIKHYNISKIIVPDYVSEKKGYEPLQEVFKAMDNVDVVSSQESYDFGSLTLKVYPASHPDEIAAKADPVDNDMSLVVSMCYGIDTFLFMGDTDEARMSEILADGIDLGANWVKMPHHGAFSDTSANDLQAQILEKVTPTYAVISTGHKEFKGDSAKATKETLSKDNIEYYCTFEGNVITRCDGANVSVSQ